MTFHKTGGNMQGAGSVAPIQETTLGQYYERKEKVYREKLTFEQWVHHRFAADAWELGLLPHLEACWKAAQENM